VVSSLIPFLVLMIRPINQGFDNFYGSMGEMVDYFHPELFSDNSFVQKEFPADYHFIEVRFKQFRGPATIFS
jgi:hypothetical protein